MVNSACTGVLWAVPIIVAITGLGVALMNPLWILRWPRKLRLALGEQDDDEIGIFADLARGRRLEDLGRSDRRTALIIIWLIRFNAAVVLTAGTGLVLYAVAR